MHKYYQAGKRFRGEAEVVRKGAGLLILPILLVSSSAGAETLFKVTATAVSASCDMGLRNSSGTLVMPAVLPQEFTSNGGTARLDHITLYFTNCSGVESGGEPGIAVQGQTLAGDDTIFNDDNSGDSGFMLLPQNYAGTLSGFRSTGLELHNGIASYYTAQDIGKDMDYTVGFVSAQPGVGPAVNNAVVANLTFKFSYK